MHIFIPITLKFNHYSNNKLATITSVESLEVVNDKDLIKISEICNQEQIYNLLFANKLKGEKYNIENAKGFITWAIEGWEKKEYFVFLIRDENNEVMGACDIKSNDFESAEIGYWMSEKNPGYMTNAIIELCAIAKEFGYKQLYGLVRLENNKSQNVLTRAGFIDAGEQERKAKGVIYKRFEQNL